MDSQQERLQRSIATFSYTPSALPEASIDIENDLKTVTENRENELLEEIERLKSQLFTIQQNKDVEDHAPPENYPNTDKLASKLPKEEASDKYPDRWSSSIPSHKYGHYPYAAIREKIHGDKKESLNDPEMISLEKSEYDNLLKEYKAQEVLITGFQKENERLAKLLKEHEDEDSARRAAFFDQQEEMNRELNKLRNAYRRDFVQHSGRMSADLLRVDLEKDATIRSLQGRLREAEAQMGDRESDLRKELEKFKRENRELVGALAVAQQHRSLYAEDHKAHHDGKLQGAIQEIRRLSEKLRWFNDNQRVIDTIESEKESIIKVFNTLIAAVLRSGVEENDLKQIVGKALHEHGLSHLQLWRPDLAAEEYSAQKDLSRITHKQTRSAADVKKIRLVLFVIDSQLFA